jgi:hypothetical protein
MATMTTPVPPFTVLSKWSSSTPAFAPSQESHQMLAAILLHNLFVSYRKKTKTKTLEKVTESLLASLSVTTD